MGKSPASLREVAQHAGVSLGTASRALNNKANVLPETRSRVLKAASDLSYKRQLRVPTTISSAINTVGVVMKRDPGELPRIDPFNYAVLCGIEDECERLGLNMMYSSLPVDEYSHAITWSSMLSNSEIDALVIVGIVITQEDIARKIPDGMPIVLVDAYSPHLHCDMVGTHNEQGAYQATRYLIDKGHRHIGLIGSTLDHDEHPSIRARRRGYLEALSVCGIPRTYIEDSLLNSTVAYEATHRLLQRAPEVTAIFACNDDIAAGVLQAAQDRGLLVPHDLSLIGFDDTHGPTPSLLPLTTMRVEKELLGATAVRYVYEYAMNHNRPPMTTWIGTTLIERGSVTELVNRLEHRPDAK